MPRLGELLPITATFATNHKDGGRLVLVGTGTIMVVTF